MNMINKELHEYLHYNFNLEIYKSFFLDKKVFKGRMSIISQD